MNKNTDKQSKEKVSIEVKLIVLALLFGFLVGPHLFKAETSVAKESQLSATNISAVGRTNPFDQLDLRAKSAYVWDINNKKEIFTKSPNTIHPLASLTKIMTALVVIENLPADRTVTIKQSDLAYDGDQGLLAGEAWDPAQLLELTLVSSSNDGASALASRAGKAIARTEDEREAKLAFVNQMNIRALSIGLTHTVFTNESGLDQSENVAGGSGSARDVARLFEYIYRKYPDILTSTTKDQLSVTSENNLTHSVENTNQLVETIPGMIASKTGYTDLAGGNLAVIADIGIGRPMVFVVLGSTRTDRFEDIRKLIERTVLAIARQ